MKLLNLKVQPKAIDFYVALAAIGKVYGLTPIVVQIVAPSNKFKLGNLSPLFPSLVHDINKNSELFVP